MRGWRSNCLIIVSNLKTSPKSKLWCKVLAKLLSFQSHTNWKCPHFGKDTIVIRKLNEHVFLPSMEDLAIKNNRHFSKRVSHLTRKMRRGNNYSEKVTKRLVSLSGREFPFVFGSLRLELLFFATTIKFAYYILKRIILGKVADKRRSEKLIKIDEGFGQLWQYSGWN